MRQFLREHRTGALVISHDRECLRACEGILELSSHGLSLFGGGFDDYLEARELERQRLRDRLEVAKRDREMARQRLADQRAQQDKRSARGARLAARGGAPKIALGGRKSAAEATSGKLGAQGQRRLDDAVRRAHEALEALRVDAVMYGELLGAELPAQKVVARASDFNVRLGHWLYENDLTFQWLGSSRVAVQGSNGSGKSTLLRALLGENLEKRGSLEVGQLRTLYLDQRLAGLNDDASVLDNVLNSTGRSEAEARNGLAQFLFSKEAVFQKVGSLSGGERLRVALAQGFLAPAPPQLLVLDEPTNNLDLVNVEFLEGIVRAFPAALVVVSHDPEFLENCEVTERLLLEPGGIARKSG